MYSFGVYIPATRSAPPWSSLHRADPDV